MKETLIVSDMGWDRRKGSLSFAFATTRVSRTRLTFCFPRSKKDLIPTPSTERVGAIECVRAQITLLVK